MKSLFVIIVILLPFAPARCHIRRYKNHLGNWVLLETVCNRLGRDGSSTMEVQIDSSQSSRPEASTERFPILLLAAGED